MLILLGAVLAPGGTALGQGESHYADIPLESLNDGLPIRLQGLISDLTLTVPVPASWEPSGDTWLEASVRASELLDGQRSSLTISINGSEVRSFKLPIATSSRVRIPFPAEMLRPGNNTLEFAGMLYLLADRDTNCDNWDDPGRWVSLDPGGTLHVSFARRAFPVDLSSLPELLVQTLENQVEGTGARMPLVVLPDERRRDDLSAVVAVGYALGSHAAGSSRWNPEIVPWSSFDASQAAGRNLIFIDQTPAALQDVAQAGTNFVAAVHSPWDPARVAVVIGDKDRTDGFTPASALSDPSRAVLLHGSVAYVDQTQPPEPPSFLNAASLEDLGYGDRTVRGIGKQDLIYRLFLPYDIQALSSTLALSVAHSPDLDTRASSIMVFLNGISVAGIVPTAPSGATDPIHIDLPAGRFRAGINFLRISFDLRTPVTNCQRAPEAVWATIFNTSEYEFISRHNPPLPSLKYIPLPFSDHPTFSFVAGRRTSSEELGGMAEMSFIMGQAGHRAPAPPEVIPAEDFDPAQGPPTNLIMIGLPSENPAINRVNELLPQPFEAGSDKLAPGYGVHLPTSDQDASVGLLQIIRSPWVGGGVVLLVTGNDGQGVQWALQIMNDPSRWTAFDGNLMVVGAQEGHSSSGSAPAEPITTSFEQTADVSGIPIIGPLLYRASQLSPGPALIAIGIALALAFVVVLAIRTLSERVTLPRPKADDRRTEDDEH
jgi:hypothetical protein